MEARNLEIVKDAGNTQSRFTITPQRLTIKLAEQDIDDEMWFVQLGLATASQIPVETVSLRGTVSKERPYFTLDNKSKKPATLVRYKFETLTAKLAEKSLPIN